MISASRTDALFHCAYQFRPGLRLLRDEPNAKAQTGTFFHGIAEAHIDGRDLSDVFVPPMADVTRAQRMAEFWLPWWAEYSAGGSWVSEVPYAYSLSTGSGRRLPPGGQRDYSAIKSDEIPGTADAVQLEADRVTIVDWKTGNVNFVTPAVESRQLKTLALSATRAHGIERAKVVIVTVSDLAPPVADEHDLDTLDLDLFEDEIRARVASIPASEPTPGEHCRFCRHRAFCDAAPAKYRNEGRKKVA